MPDKVLPLVLIIEDDRAVATLICEALAECGCQTLVASDASSALAQLDCLRPAVLTLDLGLPGISGVSLLELIRRQWSASDLPVVVITAHPHQNAVVDYHAQAVIQKPFDLDTLKATVTAWAAAGNTLKVRALEA
jgi:DNA-binding response OmpR family regulator